MRPHRGLSTPARSTPDLFAPVLTLLAGQRYWSRGLLFALGAAVQTAAGVASAGAATEVRVLFVLERQRNDLAELARKVSDPSDTASYGDYQDVDTIGGTYGASNQTKEHVNNFLAGTAGVTVNGVDPTNSFAYALMDKAAVTAIFGKVPSEVSPLVPPSLAMHVTHIAGAFDALTSSLQKPVRPLPVPMRRPYRRSADGLLATDPWPSWAMGSGTPESCPVMHASEGSCNTNTYYPDGVNSRSFTPAQLRTAYGFEASGFTGRGRTAVVLQFNEKVLDTDIDRYATAFRVGFRSSHLTQLEFADLPTYSSSKENLEATLDIETIVGLAKGVDRITSIIAPYNSMGQFFTYFPRLFSLALDKSNTGDVLTDVISVSYGLCEDDWNHYGAAGAIEALELVFQTAAAAGVTVATSAGDQGSSDCASGAPTPWLPNAESVDYPGSSPWVTVVGGTNLILHPHNSIAEAQVWNDWPLVVNFSLPPDYANPCKTPPCRPLAWYAGGGGASTRFDAPSWQQNTGHSKRMAPDIAFMADLNPATLLYHQGKWVGSGNGTSLAAPTFAAAVLLLNEFRVKNNKPKIGFANPLLYSWGNDTTKRNAYFDVTTGTNKIGNNTTQFTHLTCCEAGPHWDAATGWGSLLIDRAIHNFLVPEPAPVLAAVAALLTLLTIRRRHR